MRASRHLFTLIAAAGVTAALLMGRSAVSSGQATALVRLQSASPGVVQAGHTNLMGSARSGAVQVGSGARSDLSFQVSMFPDVLDQGQTIDVVSNESSTAWQSFRPAVSGTLQRVELLMSQTVPGTTFYITLLEGEGVSGQVLSTSSAVGGGGANNKVFLFSSAPTVQADSPYTLKIVTSAGAGVVIGSINDVYLRGQSNTPPRDLYF